MSFTLRLFVMGLVALANDPYGDSLTLVLPQNCEHHPILICDTSAQGCNSHRLRGDQGRLIKGKIRGRGKIRGFYLDNEEVTIDGGDAGVLERVDDRWDPLWFHHIRGALPDDGREASDISWTPTMAHILKKAGVIKSDVLLRPAANQIAALLTFSGIKGRIKTFHMAENCGKVSSLTFTEGGTKLWSCKQALADILVIEIPINQQYATLTVSKYGNSYAKRSMYLAPKEGERVVDVLLGNLTPLAYARDIYNNKENLVAVPHFRRYYNLSAQEIDQGSFRIPVRGHMGELGTKVNPQSLPPLLRSVSGRPFCAKEILDRVEFEKNNPQEEWDRDPRSGLSRPICTFGSFTTQ